MKVRLVTQRVKQHDEAVCETRDRYKPKETAVSNGVLDGAGCTNTEREINANDHLIVDCVVGWPAPAAQQVEIDRERYANEAGKSPQNNCGA